MKNDEILIRVGEKRALMREVQKRKGNWLWHVSRGRESLEGLSVEGEQKRGRRKLKLLGEVRTGSYMRRRKMSGTAVEA